jgi:hypothetical protein
MNHFLVGILVATASRHETISVREACRLAGIPESQVSPTLSEIRDSLAHDEPDLTTVVVSDRGTIGLGFSDAAAWRTKVLGVWAHWAKVKRGY